MEKFYFTFGSGQKFGGYCQPVVAKNWVVARKIMFDKFGEDWGFQYSEEEWLGFKNDKDRMWPLERELATIGGAE